MQRKRSKRSRNRAAKNTAGHGHKKKNRGAGNRGGRGKAGSGKRGNAKLMKVTGGKKNYLGKDGFSSLKEKPDVINVAELQARLPTLVREGKIKQTKDTYEIDLDKLKYEKLLSKGKVKAKMHISVKAATKGAVSKIEDAGGKVELTKKK